LKREVDLYMSGYLIPSLLPIEEADPKKAWGEVGSRVRGICYTYNNTKNFGFMRYISKIGPGLWITDTRRPDSPYGTAFAHESSFNTSTDVHNLPSRDLIFEFDLAMGEKGMQASNIMQVYPPLTKSGT
jgi:cold shock CspA family protein